MDLPDVLDDSLEEETSPLIDASVNGDEDEIAFCLDRPVLQIDEPDGHGRTPLMYACALGDSTTCRQLLALRHIASPRLKITARDRDGCTALMPAAAPPHAEIAAQLLGRGDRRQRRERRQRPHRAHARDRRGEAATALALLAAGTVEVDARRRAARPRLAAAARGEDAPCARCPAVAACARGPREPARWQHRAARGVRARPRAPHACCSTRPRRPDRPVEQGGRHRASWPRPTLNARVEELLLERGADAAARGADGATARSQERHGHERVAHALRAAEDEDRSARESAATPARAAGCRCSGENSLDSPRREPAPHRGSLALLPSMFPGDHAAV